MGSDTQVNRGQRISPDCADEGELLLIIKNIRGHQVCDHNGRIWKKKKREPASGQLQETSIREVLLMLKELVIVL